MATIKDIFDVWYGVNLEVVNSTVKEKGVPFVSRQSINNGVVCYVAPIEGVKPNPAHTLSIAVSGSVLSTFYHDYEYYSGRDVYVAKPKAPMTKEEMLYYAYVIEQNKYRYNYGRGANRTFRDIEVPDRNEVPSKIKKTHVPAFKNEALNNQKLILKTESWKWFNYTDLFEISGSKTTPKVDLETYGKGEFPYVTTQAVNNGVENFYNYSTEKAGVLTVDSAVLGFCSYQEKEFSASDHVEILTPKFPMNQYIALFLTTIINKEQYRYSYGRKCSQIKLRKSRIKLPVDPTGEPNWQFMEEYIKSLPYSKNLEPADPKDQIRSLKMQLALAEKKLQEREKNTIVNNIHIDTFNNYQDDHSQHLTVEK
jgi:hypothetical protein